MADRFRTPGRWTVEVVRVAELGDRPPTDMLRIRHHGFFVADVRSVDDLGTWIPAPELAQLERESGALMLAA